MKVKLFSLSILVLFASVLWAQIAVNNTEPLTITGTITIVNHPVAIIKTDNGTDYTIYMGPYWYWNQNNYKLTTGTEATVKGEVKTVNGVNELYPWEIVQNGVTIKLTDDNGVPKWSGKGNGRGKGDCPRNNNKVNGWGRGRGNCISCPYRNN